MTIQVNVLAENNNEDGPFIEVLHDTQENSIALSYEYITIALRKEEFLELADVINRAAVKLT